jgi:hypothetical protein
MDEFIIGTSARPGVDAGLIKAAGIGWVRQNFPFPFKDRLGGELTKEYEDAKKQARARMEQGFKLMGVTPLPGIRTYVPDGQGGMKTVWKDYFPAWMGRPGSDELNNNYSEISSFIAREHKGVVQMWQIANELDIPIFTEPYSLPQACDLILTAAQGLKKADPELIVGTNQTTLDKANYFHGRLFADPKAPLDYCGVDAYFGSWVSGGPESWDPLIADLYMMTGKKVLVNEWGFASQGGYCNTEERAGVVADAYCGLKKWPYTWGKGHSPDSQAAFITAAFGVFNKHRDRMLGQFFYRWEDQEKCWQCGESDCPLETAWGLVEREGKPKPGYHAFKEGVEKYFK